MSKKFKVGFIGVGNMGGALLTACAEKVNANNIIISDYSAEKVKDFTDSLGCAAGTSAEVMAEAEYVFIGVKPQAAADMFSSVKDVLAETDELPILVSMMAGRTTEDVAALAGVECPVIRIMPNLAAAVGEAMILSATRGVEDGKYAEFVGFMSEAGEFDRIPEHLIDAGSAVTGCSPAFVCMFIEAMADGAVKCGIPRDKALRYAEKAVMGTSKLLLETGKHPAAVKDGVTSPGGTTIEGVEALERGGMRYAVIDAVVSAYEKNKKL